MYVQLCAGKFQILNWRHIVHMITLHTVRGEPNQYFKNYIFAIFYFKLMTDILLMSPWLYDLKTEEGDAKQNE